MDASQSSPWFTGSGFSDSMCLDPALLTMGMCVGCLEMPCVCRLRMDVDVDPDPLLGIRGGNQIPDSEAPRDPDRMRGHPRDLNFEDKVQGSRITKQPSKGKKRRALNVTVEPSGARCKRTLISDAKKRVLEEHFRNDPYPEDNTIVCLSQQIQLESRAVKTWFANARSRLRSIGKRKCTRLPSLPKISAL